MKYHENYELKMTPSEALYHTMLKYRDQLMEIAHKLHCELFSVLDFSDKEFNEHFKCKLIDDELQFQWNIPNVLYFEHSSALSFEVNSLNFSIGRLELSYFLGQSNVTEVKRKVINNYIVTLTEVYKKYMLAYDAI